MGHFKNKYKTVSGKYIICKCGKSIYIPHPSQVKNKFGGRGVVTSHQHCNECKLEHHMNWGGKVYSHSYKPKSEAKIPLDN